MQGIVIVSASLRQTGQSNRIADWTAERLRGMEGCAWAEVQKLSDHPLPIWGDETRDRKDGADPWPAMRERLQACSGLVVVVPEYGGMVPSGLKNYFLYCGPKELADKPGLIVAVSSGRSGSYPVAELRMSSFKNNHLCYIPDQVILRGVADILHEPDSSDGADGWARERMDHALGLLLAYSKALGEVRAAGARDLETPSLRNGM